MGNEQSVGASLDSVQNGLQRLENSALRSSAGSESHWLVFWHFGGHIVRVYHDLVGIIVILDDKDDVFKKHAPAPAGSSNAESSTEKNKTVFSTTVDRKEIKLEVVNESPTYSIGGVTLFNSMSQYSYNLYYAGARIPHAHERASSTNLQLQASVIAAEYVDGATSQKYKRGVFTVEAKLYLRHEVIRTKTSTHRFNNFLELSSDAYAFYRPRAALYSVIPSLPWRIPKWVQSQGPEELEKRRSAIHTWIQKVASMPGAFMLPSLTRFLGFTDGEMKSLIEYPVPGQAVEPSGEASANPDLSAPMPGSMAGIDVVAVTAVPTEEAECV